MTTSKNLLFLTIILQTALLFISCDNQKQQQTEFKDTISINPFTQYGKASYYANSLQGNKMADGTRYQKTEFIGAHTTLPLGTKVKVTNISNEKTVVVEISDRGPYVAGRIIDLSKVAAKQLGFVKEGETEVKLEVVEAAEGYALNDSTEVNTTSNNELSLNK